MPEAKILVAQRDKVVLVRVSGRATFKISQGLRDFALPVLRSGCRQMIFDLRETEGMDSTFMGVLAMIGLEGRGSVDLVIVNASEHHRRLLSGLGVAKLFSFADESVSGRDWTSLCEAAEGAVSAGDVAGTVLAAHRTLMDIEPGNVPKFRDVVDILAEEVKRQAQEEKE